MRITIDSTPDITSINGARTRRWVGKTEGGIEVEVFVCLVAVKAGQGDNAEAEIERELLEQPEPRELRTVSLRQIL
jgi:hypothetical protein